MLYFSTFLQVVWEAVIKEEIAEPVENISGSVFVVEDVYSYRIPTLPNKRYYVSVSARNCAGNGTLALTKGDCSSEKEGNCIRL